MKTLIDQCDLDACLRKKYKFFVDEKNRVIPIGYFITLFYFKYANSLIKWQFWIKKDFLYCKNDLEFQFIFPLKK